MADVATLRKGYVQLLAFALALAFASTAPVGAADAAMQVDSFVGGPVEKADGRFVGPADIAVNEANGDTYVVDFSGRVQRFDAAGHFELSWSARGTGLAIDQSDGSVYVLNAAMGKVEKFDADGQFILSFGDGVNVTTGGDVCTAASGDVCGSGVLGTGAGAFREPDGGRQPKLAVHPVSGDVFVADGENRRVQQFHSDGSFVRAWGWDVAPVGAPGNVPVSEQQTLTIAAAAGTFKLRYGSDETAALPFDASAATVQTALEGLAGIGSGNVTVSGGPGDAAGSSPYVVSFGGALAEKDVLDLEVDAGNLSVGVGRQLACAGTPSDASLQYQWLRDGSPIAGATSSTYVTAGADAGKALQCQVVALKPAAGAVAVSAVAIGVAPTTPGPLPRPIKMETQAIPGGGVAVGASGGAEIHCVDLWPDGTSVSYRWFRNGQQIAGATADPYIVQDADLASPALFQCVATGTTAGGVYSASSTSTPTDPKPSEEVDAKASLSATQPLAKIDVASGGAFEICTTICQAGAESRGSHNGRFGPGSPEFITVDADGIVYASDRRDERIMRFDSSKTTASDLLLPPIGVPPLPSGGSGHHWSTFGLTVDPVTGNLFVARAPGGDQAIVLELDPDTLALVETHGDEANFQYLGVKAIAYRAASERLFLVYNFPISACDSCVGYFILDGDGAAPPSATIDAVTDVTAQSAVLHGSIDSDGSAAYQFEYRLQGGDWVPVGSPTWIGEPVIDLAVSTTATGLEAGVSYEARLRVDKIAGPDDVVTAESSPHPFETVTTPPEVDTFHPEARTDTTASLLGELRPNSGEATWFFEYGTTPAYGSKTASQTSGGGTTRLLRTTIKGLDPNTTYHYRLVAENEKGRVEGPDVTFTTRSPIADRGARAYEMVSPPYKVTRTLANWKASLRLGLGANPGIPALDGNSVRMKVRIFPLLDETRFPFDGDELYMRRTPLGWVTSSRLTLPLLPEVDGRSADANQIAGSGNHEVEAWAIGSSLLQPAPILDNEGEGHLSEYTRRDGTGKEGWSGWLRNVDTQRIGTTLIDRALFTDDGSVMARWGYYRGVADDPVTAADEDRSDDLQLAGVAGGATVYRQSGPPDGPVDLVNECTGTKTAGTATLVPQINSNGTGGTTADDFIDGLACARGTLTSVRGAVLGANSEFSRDGQGPAATAMSNDGRRLFFMSPDPEVAPAACAATTGSQTSCPPQLFVREYDESGEATVRWISRAQGVGNQRPNQFGRGAVFEGASRAGDYVYFKTNAPLLPSDPNAGVPITSGSGPGGASGAQDASTDLYRYELPADLETEAGTLVRVTGGPSGGADPSTNTVGADGGSAARYISDDGKRAYFVTRGVIAGADATPPTGGLTTPAGDAGAVETRNLYLFDDTGSSPAWKFVARLPFGAPLQGPAGPAKWDRCATSARIANFPSLGDGNCVRGSPDGRILLFLSRSRLTASDRDEALDLYLYDARDDELVRVSAAPPGIEAPLCTPVEEDVYCNAELGRAGILQEGRRADLLRGWGGGRSFNVAEEADGIVSVFFQSRVALVPEDENENLDVYEWREGELSLVSPGAAGVHHAHYGGNSYDGRDVFFQTTERIDPRELDDADFDLYDARVDGGFPYTPPPTPCRVLAFECESAATDTPAVPAPVTPGFVGDGNVKAGKPRCGKRKVRRRGRCISRRAARKAAKRKAAARRRAAARKGRAR